jgi:hypothetical protein
MRLVGLAVASLLLGVAPASAQYIPRPLAPIGPLPAQDVTEIVQAMGLDPVGPPLPRGPFYLQRATDDFGRLLRVTVDARRSQVIAVEPAGALRPPYGRYAGYGGPYGVPAGHGPHGRPYPAYAVPDDDADLAPTGSIMAPRAQPPRPALPPLTAAPQRRIKTATVTPARPPVPKKRPAAAPAEAAGSIEPLPASATPAAPAAAPAVPPKWPSPPVTPLE